MSAEMKYVVMSSAAFGEELVIFPGTFYHRNMAEALGQVRHGSDASGERIPRTPVSAGFTDGLRCYGRSDSLDLDARPGPDTELLQMGGIG